MMHRVLSTSNSDEKSQWKHAFFIIATIVIFVGMICVATFIFRPAHIDHCFYAIQAFEELPENSVEVLVIGSSHAWRGVDTAWLYEKYGIEAYNYGCNWQSLSTEVLFLKNALRRQNPKVVLFETFRINDVLHDMDMEGEIYYTRALPWSRAKQAYIQEAFGNWNEHAERYIAYFFPLMQFHNGWDTLEAKHFMTDDTYTKEYFLRNKGYLKMDVVEPYPVSFGKGYTQKKLGKRAAEIIEDIVKECKRRDIVLVFFTVPWDGSNFYHDAMVDISRKFGCYYIDFFSKNQEIGIDPEVDFADKGHMRHGGAKKISDYLGRYLKEVCGV